jgi:hypothetical protein
MHLQCKTQKSPSHTAYSIELNDSFGPRGICKKSLVGQAGFSFIEVLVAFALIGLVLNFLVDSTNLVMDLNSREYEAASRTVENDELTRLLSNPVYFGMLSEHINENPDLNNCANIDNKLCTADHSYPLTLFDAATNQPLVNASGSLDHNGKNEVTFKARCKDLTSTCDKAELFVIHIKTTDNGLSTLKRWTKTQPIEKTIFVKAQLPHSKTLTPDNIIADGHPINVVLLLDNSNSMTPHKQKVMDAVSALVDRLSKMDVTIRVTTITDSDANNQVHPASNIYYYFKVGVKTDLADWTATQLLPTDSEYFSQLELRSPTSGLSLTFKASDISNRISKKQVLLQYIQSQFDTPSPWEFDAGLCRLLSTIESNKVFISPDIIIDKQTPTIVYFISNEDDDSKLNPYMFDANQETGGCSKFSTTKMKRTDQDILFYYKYYKSLSVEYSGVLDGVAARKMYYIGLNIPRSEFPVAPFAYESPCSQLTFDFNLYCLPFTIHPLCSPTANPTLKVCEISRVSEFEINKFYPSNLSSDFLDISNITCTDAEPLLQQKYDFYIPKSCEIKLMKNDQIVSKSVTPIAPEYTKAHADNNIVEAIMSSVQSNIGLDNFYFVPIIHRNNTECSPTATESVGTKYLDLAHQLGPEHSTVLKICDSDYSTAVGLDNSTGSLDKIQSFVQTMALGDWTLEPQIVKTFTGLEVYHNGALVSPAPIQNKDYQITPGGVLMFSKGFIKSSADRVVVYY